MNPVIQAENVFIDYRLKKSWLNVIHDVSLVIDPLEIHGLVGESGSGKSTLALAMMRYLVSNARIRSGSITFDNQNMMEKSIKELRTIWGSQINLVPQDPLASLNPSYTIGNQIAEITRRHSNISSKEANQLAIAKLHEVKIADPEDVAKRYPHQLSGGMLQRVLIAMALSTQPKLLILDEPTTALDVTTQAVILDLFRELILENNAAGLYVSHDLGTVAQLCNRVTVLYGGEVMESTPVKQLFTHPLNPYTHGLLASLPRHSGDSETRLPMIKGVAPSLAERTRGCVFASRCPLAIEKCHTHKPALELTEDNRSVKCWRWQEIATGEIIPFDAIQADVTPAPPKPGFVLDAKHITKTFGTPTLLDRLTRKPFNPVHAVGDVSVTINIRSTLGIVGESGSGKTTLARCIVALHTANDGEIDLCGVNIERDLTHRTRDTLRNLQMVFQNPNDALNPYQSVGQAIGRTLQVLGNGNGWTKEQINTRVIELLEAVRLTSAYANRYPSELSGGEKQRVAIARAFAADPALVVADEPTSSLDVSVQAVILNLLKDLRAQKGVSYLLISHDLDVVAYLSDWIAVMYLGQIVEEGLTQDVYGFPSHPYTEALLSAIPIPDPTADSGVIRLEGDIPSAKNMPTGCRFHTRCPRKIGSICETALPPWRNTGDNHHIRCHIPIHELSELQQEGMKV